mgnify:FL=1
MKINKCLYLGKNQSFKNSFRFCLGKLADIIAKCAFRYKVKEIEILNGFSLSTYFNNYANVTIGLL